MYMYMCMTLYTCTALMRPNQAETVLSAVAHSLVPHDYSVMYMYIHMYMYMYMYMYTCMLCMLLKLRPPMSERRHRLCRFCRGFRSECRVSRLSVRSRSVRESSSCRPAEWNQDQVVWNDDRNKGNENQDQVVWNNDRNKGNENQDQVVWNNDRNKGNENQDQVVWNNDRNKGNETESLAPQTLYMYIVHVYTCTCICVHRERESSPSMLASLLFLRLSPVRLYLARGPNRGTHFSWLKPRCM